MLEVHQEESPGEPMKPASELFAEFPHETWWGGHLPEKCRRCRLQAWLREADSEMVERQKVHGIVAARCFCSDLRHDLLGTTQKPKQEGE